MNVRVNPRIIGAVIFGAILIGGSYWLATHSQLTGNGKLGVASAGDDQDLPRYELYDQSQLINPDWQDHIQPYVVGGSSTTASSTYAPPNTLTGKYGVHLLKAIMSSNMEKNGPTVQEIVDDSITQLNQATADALLTPDDITTTMDISAPTLKAYGNKMMEVTLYETSPYKTAGDPLDILVRVQKSGDAADLEPLETHIKYYESVLQATKEIEVPVIYQGVHLEIMNAYLAHINDLRAIQKINDDPLLTIARMRNYIPHLEAIYNGYNKLYEQMKLNGVTWSDTDLVGQYLQQQN